jgi:hypothetical protein
VLKD